MTTTLFYAILTTGGLILFVGTGIALSAIMEDSIGIGIASVITIAFVFIYGAATPSMEQMTENDYYAMLEDRPKCIDAGDVSLGCKKDYIVWQKDSVEKQHKYDSLKVILENGIIKNVTIPPEVKPDTSVSDTLRTCIEQCWKFAMNSDIKKCQDECFK